MSETVYKPLLGHSGHRIGSDGSIWRLKHVTCRGNKKLFQFKN